jgi:hypothetical protein
MLGFGVSAHTGLIELSHEFGLFHGTPWISMVCWVQLDPRPSMKNRLVQPPMPNFIKDLQALPLLQSIELFMSFSGSELVDFKGKAMNPDRFPLKNMVKSL